MSTVSPILLNFQTFCAIGLNRMLLAIYKLKCGCFQAMKVIFSLQFFNATTNRYTQLISWPKY